MTKKKKKLHHLCCNSFLCPVETIAFGNQRLRNLTFEFKLTFELI